MKGRGHYVHPVTVARRATRRRMEGTDEAGFTLIELVVVVAILPIVVGGIVMALLSVFSLQGTVTNRVGDSNDALVASAYFNRDVQSAASMTVQSQMGGSSYGCGTATQTQLLGLEWGTNSSANGGFQTFVSYVSVPTVNPQTGVTTYSLLRQVCTSGSSTTPTTTIIVSHDVGSAPTVHIYESGASGPFTEVTGTPGDPFLTWASSQGVTKVAFSITEPGSGFSYSLVGLPATSASQASVTSTTLPSSGNGCGFATPGSGTYSTQLCFVDFTGYTGSTGACQQMSGPVQNTPYTVSFCIKQTTSAYSPNQTAYPDAPWPIPTYYDQTYNSEAFLGNNGFYTGISGNPALYEHTCSPAAAPTSSPCNSGDQWTMSTVTVTNFKVLDAAGQPATGWTLVTGDAESTDSGEWLVFQNTSGVNWSVLSNSPSNPYGNACYNDNASQIPANDTTNSGFLKFTANSPLTVGNPVPQGDTATISLGAQGQTGTTSVMCESDQQLNKTGTLMLSAPVPTSGSSEGFTVTMNGHGWGEAFFMGVLL